MKNRIRHIFALVILFIPVFSCKKEEKPGPQGVDMTSTKTTVATILWSDCNLGASSPQMPGNYYVWDGSDPCSDIFGEGWRMPTRKELHQLIESCIVERDVPYSDENWVVGFTFTSKSTGNVLYFPVWGYKDENGNTVSYNQYGYYWSSDEEDEENASVLRLDLIHGERVSSKEKRYALQIRPVKDIKQ